MIQAKGVCFSYSATDPFRFADFHIQKGEKVFIQGPSGAGKTTFLQILSGILRPQNGSLTIAGKDLSKMSSFQRDAFRKDYCGFVFQQFNLLPYLSLYENIALPLRFSNKRKARALENNQDLSQAVNTYLEMLGLQSFANQTPQNISQGQKQRIAIARACIGNPPILLADEPTSSLDGKNVETTMNLLMDQCNQNQTTLLFVSHDPRLKPYFDRCLEMESLLL